MMKCIKKIDTATWSGAGSSRLPTCKHFESLLFIRDTVANKATESNIQINTALNEDSLQIDDSTFPNTDTFATPGLSPSPAPSSASSLTSSKRRRSVEDSFLEESRERRNKLDTLITKAFEERQGENNKEEDDQNLLFCKSLVPTLKRLDNRANAMAKIEIQKVLFNYEFGSD